jgi:hypothetical protein
VPVFALFPVAPPRLADIGIADSVSQHTFDLAGRSTIFYNPLAAGRVSTSALRLPSDSRSRWHFTTGWRKRSLCSGGRPCRSRSLPPETTTSSTSPPASS